MKQRDPDLFLVFWNGEMLELEALDAITFSKADAEAVLAASPGRRESYSIEQRELAILLASEPFASLAERLQRRIKARDLSPLMLRDEAERQRRVR
jgi:hypothetical protein